MQLAVLVRARRPGGAWALPQVVRVVSRIFGNGTTNRVTLGLLRPPPAELTGTECAWQTLPMTPVMSSMLPLWTQTSEAYPINALPAH